MDFIVLDSDFEFQVDTNNLIKSVLTNEKGNPILRKDLIEKIHDVKISDDLKKIGKKEKVERMPKVGEPLKQGTLYCSEWGMIKCKQSHNRSDYKSEDIDTLFSYYEKINIENNVKIAK